MGTQIVLPELFTGPAAAELPYLIPPAPVAPAARWIMGATVGYDPGDSLLGIRDSAAGVPLSGVVKNRKAATLVSSPHWLFPVGDFDHAGHTTSAAWDTSGGLSLTMAFRLKSLPAYGEPARAALTILGTGGPAVYLTNNQLYVYGTAGSVMLSTAPDLLPHVLTFTYNGTQLQGFYDGARIEKTTPITLGAAARSIAVGASEAYDGVLEIADLSIHTKALGSSDAKSYASYLAELHFS